MFDESLHKTLAVFSVLGRDNQAITAQYQCICRGKCREGGPRFRVRVRVNYSGMMGTLLQEMEQKPMRYMVIETEGGYLNGD